MRYLLVVLLCLSGCSLLTEIDWQEVLRGDEDIIAEEEITQEEPRQEEGETDQDISEEEPEPSPEEEVTEETETGLMFNPVCSGAMGDDGPNGTKWKPRSERNGLPVFVISPRFQGQFREIMIASESTAGRRMTFDKWSQWDSTFNNVQRVIDAAKAQDVPDISCGEEDEHADNDHWNGCRNAPHRQVWRINVPCGELPRDAKIVAYDSKQNQNCVWQLSGSACNSWR